MDVRQITREERAKYKEIWLNYDYRSNTALMFAELLVNVKGINGICLDIGCGDGSTVRRLRNLFSIDCYGVDITLAGMPMYEAPIYRQAPAWKLPYRDNYFDYTFSTDVFEHIPPEMVTDTIREIDRITATKTTHQICTRDAVQDYCGHKVHLTIQPIEWWGKQFDKYYKGNYEIIEV